MKENRQDIIIRFVQEQMERVHTEVASIVTPLFDHPDIVPEKEFDCYPLLFAETFPNVGDDNIKQLSFAFRLGWEYVSISDPMFDTSGGITPSNIICAQLFLAKFLRELYKLFNVDSPFFGYYEQYLHDFSRAVLTEIIKIRYGLGSFTFEEFKDYAANRMSFGKIVIAGLATFEDSQNKINPLAKSHDFFYIAALLRDDLVDWYEDYEKKRYTFLIRKALSLHNIGPDDYIRRWPTLDKMRKMIYFSDAADWVLDKSENYYRKALKEASVFEVPMWKSTIDRFLHSSHQLRNDLEKIRK